MSVIIVLIAFSICVAGGFLIAFLWAVRSGQYEDPHTPSIRILFEDHPHTHTTTTDHQS
jgi:cbb3-type cytochrome oxidase maturation protein